MRVINDLLSQTPKLDFQTLIRVLDAKKEKNRPKNSEKTGQKDSQKEILQAGLSGNDLEKNRKIANQVRNGENNAMEKKFMPLSFERKDQKLEKENLEISNRKKSNTKNNFGENFDESKRILDSNKNQTKIDSNNNNDDNFQSKQEAASDRKSENEEEFPNDFESINSQDSLIMSNIKKSMTLSRKLSSKKIFPIVNPSPEKNLKKTSQPQNKLKNQNLEKSFKKSELIKKRKAESDPSKNSLKKNFFMESKEKKSKNGSSVRKKKVLNFSIEKSMGKNKISKMTNKKDEKSRKSFGESCRDFKKVSSKERERTKTAKEGLLRSKSCLAQKKTWNGKSSFRQYLRQSMAPKEEKIETASVMKRLSSASRKSVKNLEKLKKSQGMRQAKPRVEKSLGKSRNSRKKVSGSVQKDMKSSVKKASKSWMKLEPQKREPKEITPQPKNKSSHQTPNQTRQLKSQNLAETGLSKKLTSQCKQKKQTQNSNLPTQTKNQNAVSNNPNPEKQEFQDQIQKVMSDLEDVDRLLSCMPKQRERSQSRNKNMAIGKNIKPTFRAQSQEQFVEPSRRVRIKLKLKDKRDDFKQQKLRRNKNQRSKSPNESLRLLKKSIELKRAEAAKISKQKFAVAKNSEKHHDKNNQNKNANTNQKFFGEETFEIQKKSGLQYTKSQANLTNKNHYSNSKKDAKSPQNYSKNYESNTQFGQDKFTYPNEPRYSLKNLKQLESLYGPSMESGDWERDLRQIQMKQSDLAALESSRSQIIRDSFQLSVLRSQMMHQSKVVKLSRLGPVGKVIGGKEGFNEFDRNNEQVKFF